VIEFNEHDICEEFRMLTLKIGFNVFSVIQITDQLGATVSIGDSERWYSNI